jgi:hypothetical protein
MAAKFGGAWWTVKPYAAFLAKGTCHPPALLLLF